MRGIRKKDFCFEKRKNFGENKELDRKLCYNEHIFHKIIGTQTRLNFLTCQQHVEVFFEAEWSVKETFVSAETFRAL